VSQIDFFDSQPFFFVYITPGRGEKSLAAIPVRDFLRRLLLTLFSALFKGLMQCGIVFLKSSWLSRLFEPLLGVEFLRETTILTTLTLMIYSFKKSFQGNLKGRRSIDVSGATSLCSVCVACNMPEKVHSQW
jgi:hypothetical protein